MPHASGSAPIRLLTVLALITTLGFVGCSPGSETSQDSTSANAESLDDEAPEGAFTIGELSGLALRDGGLDFPNDSRIFGVGHTPAEVAELVGAAGLPADKLSLSIQPLLVKSADRVLLFDTGAGANMGPGSGSLFASLTAAGVDPLSVTDVFISHAHGDHVGGLLNAEGAPAFPNAVIHISAAEWAFLRGMNAEAAANVAIARHAALIAAIEPRVAGFAPNADIIPGVVSAVEIRGHTPGHSGYLITSGQSSLLYVGDAMHHFVVSVQKPEWAVNFDADATTAEASRADLLARSADSGQRIYAVHFPFPGVGKVERRATGFAWVPE